MVKRNPSSTAGGRSWRAVAAIQISFEGIGFPFLYNAAEISPNFCEVAVSTKMTSHSPRKSKSFFSCLTLLTTRCTPTYNSPNTVVEMKNSLLY